MKVDMDELIKKAKAKILIMDDTDYWYKAYNFLLSIQNITGKDFSKLSKNQAAWLDELRLTLNK